MESELQKKQLLLAADEMPLLRECAFFKSEDGFMHPNRVLDFDVLIYVVSGSVQVVEDDQEYCILPGELLFLKHGCHHYGTKRNPPMTSWYYFHFYLPKITAQTRFDPFESFTYACSLNKENHSFFYQLPKKMKMESYSNIAQMQEICDLFEKRNPLERLLQNTMLCSLLLNLYHDSESDRKVALSRQRTDQMIAYLQKHCEEKFSSVDIETYMGLSYKHLNDVFKKETGMTLQKYHCQMRMERAARLLQQTDLTVTQISERLGFDEVFYFSNVFKKQMKLSPMSYRKKCVRI